MLPCAYLSLDVTVHVCISVWECVSDSLCHWVCVSGPHWGCHSGAWRTSQHGSCLVWVREGGDGISSYRVAFFSIKISPPFACVHVARKTFQELRKIGFRKSWLPGMFEVILPLQKRFHQGFIIQRVVEFSACNRSAEVETEKSPRSSSGEMRIHS